MLTFITRLSTQSAFRAFFEMLNLWRFYIPHGSARGSGRKKTNCFCQGGVKRSAAHRVFLAFFPIAIGLYAVSRNTYPHAHARPRHTSRTPTPRLCAHAPTPTPTPTHNACTHTRSGIAHTHITRPHHAHITHARTFLLSFRMPNLCSNPSKNHLFSNIFKNSQK